MYIYIQCVNHGTSIRHFIHSSENSVKGHTHITIPKRIMTNIIVIVYYLAVCEVLIFKWTFLWHMLTGGKCCCGNFITRIQIFLQTQAFLEDLSFTFVSSILEPNFDLRWSEFQALCHLFPFCEKKWSNYK